MSISTWHVRGRRIIPPEDAPWADFADGGRHCHFCGHPCLPEDHPTTSKDGEHYAHFTCWYDNGPMPPARLNR